MELAEKQKVVKEMLESPQPPKKEATSAKPAKKPYSKPELIVYGALRDITGAVGMTGAMDGGVSPTDKTRT